MDPEVEKLTAMKVSAGYFEVYGVVPFLGRTITADDTRRGAPQAVVISHEYWRRRFGGNNSVIGQSLSYQDQQATIVGVLPRTFFKNITLWLPLRTDPGMESLRGSGGFVHARLRPNVGLEVAAQELTAIAMTGAPDATRPQPRVLVRSLFEETAAEHSITVTVLGASVLLIMLIACVNVAGLLVARGVGREAELSVRASLGASRVRLVRQLLTESLVLCALGGIAGVTLAWLSLDLFVTYLPMTLPPNSTVRLDPTILAYAAAITLVTGLAFGLPPAVRLSGAMSGDMVRFKRDAGAPLSRRGGQMLIAIEIALTVILLAGAGVMIRSFGRLLNVDLGFDPGGFMTMEVAPVDSNRSAQTAYYARLLEAVRALPGVTAAGAADQVPLAGNSTSSNVRVPQKGEVSVKVRHVLPGYVEAAGIPLISGRDLRETDRSGRSISAVLVNREAARRLFPDSLPIGQRLTFEDQDLEVVGVVGDIRHRGPLRPVDPEVYAPFRPEDPDSTGLSLTVVVRPTGRTAVSEGQLRSLAKAVGPQVVVERIRSGNDSYNDIIARHRQRTALISLLGSLAMFIALVGIVSVTGYATARRSKEIALRIAFGAGPHQVVRGFVLDSILPASIGIVVGLAVAALCTRALKSFLFDTAPTDPLAFIAVALTMWMTAGIAAWAPARLAVGSDPAGLLRGE